MIVYFDTSALIKLLVEEEASEDALALWDAADSRVTSRLAYPESRAALAAAERDGRISRTAHRAAKASLGELWASFHVVGLEEELAREAGDLAERLHLRGYDAVHLASARAVAGDDFVLATWDRDLAGAAERMRLATAPHHALGKD